MKEKKELVYYDQNSEMYHKYSLVPSEKAIFDTNEFFDYLYSMKLDAGYSNFRILKEGVSTADLRRVYSEIIESKVIDFSALCDLYDLEKVQTIAVVSAHINKFLSMYNLETDIEYSDEEVSKILKDVSEENSKSKEEAKKINTEMNSVKYNSIFMNIVGFNFIKQKNKVLVNC